MSALAINEFGGVDCLIYIFKAGSLPHKARDFPTAARLIQSQSEEGLVELQNGVAIVAKESDNRDLKRIEHTQELTNFATYTSRPTQ